jgi:hypothetical protein
LRGALWASVGVGPMIWSMKRVGDSRSHAQHCANNLDGGSRRLCRSSQPSFREIVLPPTYGHLEVCSEWPDLNSRPPVPQAGALRSTTRCGSYPPEK